MSKKPVNLSVKAVICNEEGRFLLLKRSMNSKGNPGKWDLPGGKLDSGENIEEGLLREVAEEAGVSISLGQVLGAAESETPTTRVVYLIFEGDLQSGEVDLSHEHDDYVWLQKKDLPSIDILTPFLKILQSYQQRKE